EIRAPRVRLIGNDGEQIGIVLLQEALRHAEEAELDLVEISPSAKPPVCKIMDFGQYYYHKERKAREARKKQHVVQTKEVKFGPNTEEHDYNFKKDHIIKFLKQHNKVKLTVRFKGRQLAHKNLGFDLLEKLQEDLKDIIDVDSKPKSEGRQISMTVAPKKDIDEILKKEKKDN
ncbi:MAG: translation initiation factor IF-3, partial [Candidatus Cloacimonadota bacterium]|nr:translation initiation factor IF-3 [Candidatus Cloacimonadota bacterium]